MREFGVVNTGFWGSPDIRGLSGDGKLLALYLITGPHSNGIGAYRLPSLYLCADLDWEPADVDGVFAELAAVGFAARDGDFVIVPRFLRWNPIVNPNSGKARAREFDSLPSGKIKRLAANSLLELGAFLPNGFDTVLKQLANGSATVPDGLRDNRSDQIRSDQIKNRSRTDQRTTAAARPSRAEDPQFKQFKLEYPQRSGNQPWGRAAKAISARLSEGHSWTEIHDGARRYRDFCRATGKEQTEHVMQAATFCGPDKPFLQLWNLPATRADTRLQSNVNAAAQAKQRLFGAKS